MLYGDAYKLWVDSRLGEGTITGIDLPEHAGTHSPGATPELAESRKA